MNRFDLSGQLALVTGSSQGIGLAIAEGLAEAGARIVINGRDGQKLEAARAALAAKGFDVSVAAFDVTDEDAVATGIGRH